MVRSKRELLFIAKGENDKGESCSHNVHKNGGSIFVSGPNFKEHLCHPSVSSAEQIKREIYLVFQTKVTDIEMP